MDEAAENERALLGSVLHQWQGQPPGRSELDWVTVLVDGLIVAVCRPTRPMARDVARAALVEAVEALLPATGPRTSSS